MTRRTVQTSMFPDIAPDYPFGPIVGSVQRGTNADLIAAVAPLYLTGSVCDVTYGTGGWWRRFQPHPFTAHDLDPEKGDGVDFTALPEADDTYDTMCFDPPYVASGGYESSTRKGSLRDAFGNGPDLNHRAMTRLVLEGLGECARVTRRWVLAKCMDYADGGGLYLGHMVILEHAAAIGLECHDLIVHHTGAGPGGHNIYQPRRARRHHSYLLVFRK